MNNDAPKPDDLNETAQPQHSSSLTEHLIELRKRLVWCLLVIGILMIGAWEMADHFLNFLIVPLHEAMEKTGGTQRLIMTGLTEGFVTHLKVACFVGFFLAVPFILYQGWAFVAPGLYRREQTLVWPFLVASPFMFILGASFVYYLIMPNAWPFFLSFQTGAEQTGLAIQMETRLNDYLNLIMSFLIAFGLIFQLPVVLVILGRAGIVSAEMLRHGRRLAIVMAFVAGAFLTPPDVLSQLSLAVPIIGFYEISILIIAAIERSRLAAPPV